MAEVCPCFAVTDADFLGGVFLFGLMVQQVIISLNHFLIAYFTLFLTCNYYRLRAQVSSHNVMAVAIFLESLVFNKIRFSQNLCRLVHRPEFLKGYSFVFSYYKFTNFF